MERTFTYLTEGQGEALRRLTERLKFAVWVTKMNKDLEGLPSLQREHLRARGSQILGWEMGTGKTRVALAYLDAFREIAGEFLAPHLILAPANVIPVWVEEARRVGTRTRLIAPGSRALYVRKAVEEATEDTAIAISYDTLRLHFHDGAIADRAFGVVVADEAHALQSARAKRTRMARLLDCAVFLAVTGTPYTSNPLQLMGLARTMITTPKQPSPLAPQPHAELTDAYTFRNSYVMRGLRDWIGPGHLLPPLTSRITDEVYVLTPHYGKSVHPLHAALDDLGDMHAPAQDLPPLIVYRVGVPLDEATRTEYNNAVLLRAAHTYNYGGLQFVRLRNALARLTYLLQLCADPRLAVRAILESPNVVWASSRLPTPPRGGKVEVLAAVCEEARKRGLKVVAFTEFARLAHILEEDEVLAPYHPLTATGDIPRKAFQAHIREFLENPDRTLLLATRAAREGLNLQGASVVVLYGKVGWNAQDLEQAVGRLHRRGQKRPVLAFQLYAPDTVEEDLNSLYAHKAFDFAKAVRGKGIPDSPLLYAKKLSPEGIPGAFSTAYGD